jgi:hypothetical protein
MQAILATGFTRVASAPLPGLDHAKTAAASPHGDAAKALAPGRCRKPS